MLKTNKIQQLFTLIELLVVIAIIGILVSMLFIAENRILNKNEQEIVAIGF